MSKKLLYDLRAEKGFTINDLARMWRVSTRTIMNWENGYCVPNPKRIDDIAEFYNLESKYIESQLVFECTDEGCTSRAYKDRKCKLHFYEQGKPDVVRFKITNEMKEQKTLGERLRLMRTSRGIEEEDLAKKFGVTRSTILAWEQNIIEPSRLMIIDIASLFKVDTAFLDRGLAGRSEPDG